VPDDRWLYGWAMGYAAVGAASLLVPLYAIELGADAFLVGLLAATAAVAGVPGAILWGKLAGRTGRRRPFVLVALAATAVVLATMPLLDGPWSVLAANAVLWFFVAATAPVLNLIVVAGVPEKAWEGRFARLNAIQGYGWLGGLLGGALWTALTARAMPTLVAHRSFFLVTAAAALLGLVTVRGYYPEQSRVTERRFRTVYRRMTRRRGWGSGRYVRAVPFGPSRLYWALRTVRVEGIRDRFSPALGRYLAVATLFFGGFSLFFGPLPAYLTGAGYGTGEVFLLFVVSSAGSAATYELAGRLAATHDVRVLQTGALSIRVVAFPLVVLLGGVLPAEVGLVAVAALFAAIGVSWAVIAVTATGLVTRLTPEPIRGEALGLYAALGGLGGAVGSAAGGALAEVAGYLVTFGVAGGVVLVTAVLVFGSGRTTA